MKFSRAILGACIWIARQPLKVYLEWSYEAATVNERGEAVDSDRRRLAARAFPARHRDGPLAGPPTPVLGVRVDVCALRVRDESLVASV